LLWLAKTAVALLDANDTVDHHIAEGRRSFSSQFAGQLLRFVHLCDMMHRSVTLVPLVHIEGIFAMKQ